MEKPGFSVPFEKPSFSIEKLGFSVKNQVFLILVKTACLKSEKLSFSVEKLGFSFIDCEKPSFSI